MPGLTPERWSLWPCRATWPRRLRLRGGRIPNPIVLRAFGAQHSCHDGYMGLMLAAGDKFEMKGRTITVTQVQALVGPRTRDVLIEVARRGERVTYGDLKARADLTHAPNGMGRLLDVLSEDCRLRNEPSLAPLVVNAETNEVGDDYEGDPTADRAAVYDYWS